MSSGFYRAFEDVYRGSREKIKSRQAVYLPFIDVIKLIRKDCSAVDLGCGRGEWLELLRDANVDARGVDLDDGMLDACRKIGLNVEHGDALSFIKSLPDKSQDIVSGFHFIEHIPFEDLSQLIQEALRVLKPAGLLVLETPNPENITVATTNFYLDPTHLHPIPHPLLSFLSQYYGFYRTKVMRLQESPDSAIREQPTLLDVLREVSPDYAIVAQKNAQEEDLMAFNQVFSQDHGISIEELAARYDSRIHSTVHDLEGLRNDLSGIRADLAILRTERDRLRTSLEKAVAERDLLVTEKDLLLKDHAKDSANLAWMRTELDVKRAEAEEFKHQYYNVLFSLSYRITAPLRSVYLLLYRLRRQVFSRRQHQVTNTSNNAADGSNESSIDVKYFSDLIDRGIKKRRKSL